MEPSPEPKNDIKSTVDATVDSPLRITKLFKKLRIDPSDQNDLGLLPAELTVAGTNPEVYSYSLKFVASKTWPVSKDPSLNLFLNFKNDDDLWRVKFCLDKKLLFNATVATISVNLRRLEELLVEGQLIPREKYLFWLVNSEVEALWHKGVQTTKSNIPFSPDLIVQPKGFTEQFKLYPYQLDAISFMKEIENSPPKTYEFSVLTPWRASRLDYVFDLQHEKIIHADDLEQHDKIGKLTAGKGGILADEMGLGKTSEILGLVLANPAPKELPQFSESGLINAKATLVISPNHIAQQWVDELEKHTARNNFRVVLMALSADMKRVTYKDVVEADVVIFSAPFLKNKTYFTAGCGKKKIPLGGNGLEKRIKVLLELLAAMKKLPYLETLGPILDHFHWHRVVIDEGHEVLPDSLTSKMISCLSRNYSWYVSATPFPTYETMLRVYKFLSVEFERPADYPETDYEKWMQCQMLIKNLLWRHTKEDIKLFHSAPPSEEETIFAELSDAERALYNNAAYTSEKMDVCLGRRVEFTINNTLAKHTAVRQDLFNYTLQQYTRYTREPPRNEAEERAVEARKKELDECSADLQRWLEVPRIQCRREIDELSAFRLPEDREKKLKKMDLLTHDELINLFGAKIAALAKWLKEITENDSEARVILFSRNFAVLDRLKFMLNGFGIGHSSMRGNIVTMTRALKEFKTDAQVKVILLTLDRTASGTNLVEASHVVLLDPLQSSYEEVQAAEKQAIGRACRQGQTKKVKVVRFIVKDSVEEELYWRNKQPTDGEDKETN